MKTTRMIVIAAFAGSVLLGQGAVAGENAEARDLFYQPGSNTSKAMFGDGRVRINPDTKPGQDLTPENLGGLGGLTDYYEKLDNPGVMYYIELRRRGSSNVKRVSGSRVFKTGDRIRIHIVTNGDGYLHALHKGTTGRNQLIPVSAGGRVRGGNETVIPSSGWLLFDHNKGTEKVDLVFASHARAADAGMIPTHMNASVINVVQSTIDRYSTSKDLVSYTQEGEKDLIVEGGGPYAVSAGGMSGIGRPGYTASVQTIGAPGTYSVNTGGAPVVVKVLLKHQ